MTGGVTAGIDEGFVPACAPGVVAVDAGGEALLVDEAIGGIHLLNRSAALLWSCFDGAAPIGDICADLADVLDVPYEQVLADTVAVVADLRAEGLCADGRAGPPPRSAAARGDATAAPDQALDVARHPRLLEEPPNE